MYRANRVLAARWDLYTRDMSPSACDHCLDLPRHSICTDSRKRACNVQMGSRVHAFNGCNISRLRCYSLAYRKRAAKLIFGHGDIHGHAFLGRSHAVIRCLSM